MDGWNFEMSTIRQSDLHLLIVIVPTVVTEELKRQTWDTQVTNSCVKSPNYPGWVVVVCTGACPLASRCESGWYQAASRCEWWVMSINIFLSLKSH